MKFQNGVKMATILVREKSKQVELKLMAVEALS